MYTKLAPEKGHCVSFTLKSIWNHLHLFIFVSFFGITYKVFSANLNITLHYWFSSAI